MDVLFFPVRNDCEILISVTRDFFLFQTLKKEIIAVVFVFSCIKLNLCTKYTYSVFFLLSDLNKHNTYTQTKEKKKTIDSIKAPPPSPPPRIKMWTYSLSMCWNWMFFFNVYFIHLESVYPKILLCTISSSIFFFLRLNDWLA